LAQPVDLLETRGGHASSTRPQDPGCKVIQNPVVVYCYHEYDATQYTI
jgi:hypothetical protein